MELSIQAIAWFVKQPIFDNTNKLLPGLSFVHDPYEWPPIGDYNLIGWWKLATANNRVLEETRVPASSGQKIMPVDVRYEIRYVPIVSYLEDMVLHNAGKSMTNFSKEQVISYTKVAYELRMHVKHDFTCKAVFWAKERVDFGWKKKFEDREDKDDNIRRMAFKAKLLCAKIPTSSFIEQPQTIEPSIEEENNKAQEKEATKPPRGLNDVPDNEMPDVKMLKEKRYGYDSDTRESLSDCTVSVYMHSFTRLALKYESDKCEGENCGCAYANPGGGQPGPGGWSEEAIRDAKSTSDGEELYFEEQRDQARRDAEKEKKILKEHLGYSFERAIMEANEHASTAVHDDAIHRLTMHPLLCNSMAPAKIETGSPDCIAQQLQRDPFELWPIAQGEENKAHYFNRNRRKQ